MRNLGLILLAIWLILYGAVGVLGVNIPSGDLLLAILAVAAGVLILVGQRKLRFSGNLGMLLLAIWLIASGLMQILGINFPSGGLLMAILAIAAGILLLLKR